jgi:hypothetical protein
VIALFNQEHIPCAVIGAAALAVHGIPRSTYDIDVLTTSPRVLEEPLWTQLIANGVSVEIRCGDRTDPLRGVVRLQRSGERDVDVVAGRQKWQGEAIGRAVRARVHGEDVPVVIISDLILLKLYAGGHQDVWDIEQLMALGEPEVRTQVDAQIRALPDDSQSRWAEIMSRRRDG